MKVEVKILDEKPCKEKLRKRLWKKKKIIFVSFLTSIIILFPISLLVDNEYAKRNTFFEDISDTSKNTLHLATFNIHQFWDEKDRLNNLNKLRDLIKAEDIDIIGFQEMWLDDANYLANELQMYYFNNSETQQSTFHGLALLSKYPITEPNQLEMNNGLLTVNRAIIWAKILYNEVNITVYVTHLDTPASYFTQLNQAKQILDIVKNNSKSMVLCDCNAPDTIFLESYRLLTENFEDGWVASGRSTFEGRTWPSNNPFLRVDYVWLSKGDWLVQNGSGKNIGNTSYSDHLGVKITAGLNFK